MRKKNPFKKKIGPDRLFIIKSMSKKIMKKKLIAYMQKYI